jgi:hypothetical protein
VCGAIAGAIKTIALQDPALLRTVNWTDEFNVMLLTAMRGRRDAPVPGDGSFSPGRESSTVN